MKKATKLDTDDDGSRKKNYVNNGISPTKFTCSRTHPYIGLHPKANRNLRASQAQKGLPRRFFFSIEQFLLCVRKKEGWLTLFVNACRSNSIVGCQRVKVALAEAPRPKAIKISMNCRRILTMARYKTLKRK